jgi:hypothetical protein
MQSSGKGELISHNASEGVEPRNMTCCIGRGGSPLRSQHCCTRYGERVSGVPGSKTMAGHSKIHSGTWESHIVPKETSNEPKRRRRKYDGMAVGLTHSRGVDGVMPIESPDSLEGVSRRTQRDE